MNSNPPPIEPLQPSQTPPPGINWFVFFGSLLAPSVITLLAAMAKIDGLAIAIPLIGGALAGIACGIMLGRRFGRTQGARVLFCLLFIAVFGFVSFILGFVGCMVGGFTMNFQ